jgi:hypothetical protein
MASRKALWSGHRAATHDNAWRPHTSTTPATPQKAGQRIRQSPCQLSGRDRHRVHRNALSASAKESVSPLPPCRCRLALGSMLLLQMFCISGGWAASLLSGGAGSWLRRDKWTLRLLRNFSGKQIGEV